MDRVELKANPSLSEGIEEALAEADSLVVLRSKLRWVGQLELLEDATAHDRLPPKMMVHDPEMLRSPAMAKDS